MPIRHTTADLMKRGPRVASLVRPLVTEASKIQVQRFPSVRGYVLGVLPRGLSAALVANPDDPRVPTARVGTFFNYHEIWMPVAGTDKYDLNRAYLHLYLKRSAADPELQALSLHCDPNLPSSDAAYMYKRGPHLHIGGSTPSIDRAHLSLCVGDAAFGGNNVGALMTKFRKSIDMIATELLPCYA